MNVQLIEPQALNRAVHGVGAVVVLNPEGFAMALVAYSRSTGVPGGVLASYSVAKDELQDLDLSIAQDLLDRAGWILAHGARALKPQVASLIPGTERKNWVCSQGMVDWPAGTPKDLSELLAQRGSFPTANVPTPLQQVFGLVALLAEGEPTHLAEVLRRGELA